jgi:hypothetical protein
MRAGVRCPPFRVSVFRHSRKCELVFGVHPLGCPFFLSNRRKAPAVVGKYVRSATPLPSLFSPQRFPLPLGFYFLSLLPLMLRVLALQLLFYLWIMIAPEAGQVLRDLHRPIVRREDMHEHWNFSQRDLWRCRHAI